MPRTILVHLNVEAPDGDSRNADEIADSILAAIEAGMGGAAGDLASGNALSADGLVVVCPLAEEV